MHDIAIVGAGPVGTLLAVELAARGLDVVLLERRVSPSMHSRAIGIHPPSLAILERLGLAPELLTNAVRITGGEVRCDGRALGSLSFDTAGARFPFVASVPQFVTEQLLRGELDRLRSGALREGVTVTGLNQSAGFVELTTDTAPEADRGTASTVWARYVVAADGARSAVRAWSGIPWRRQGGVRSYAMADFLDESAGAPDTEGFGRGAVLYFERGGVVESLPLPGGRNRWVVMTDRHRSEISPVELAGIIRDRTGTRLPMASDSATAATFIARQHRADHFVSGRVILIGDAAHELSPIGGQGMNLGWIDAAELAPVLDGILRDRQGEAGSAALANWERRRQRSARRAVRQASFNMAMGARRGGLLLRARNVAVRMLAAPPLGVLLARAFTMRGL